MSRRILILGVILLFRMFAGGILGRDCVIGQKVIVTGKIYKVFHTVSKEYNNNGGNKWETSIQVGHFVATVSGFADLVEGRSVRLVGKCQQNLLEFLIGNLRLSQAKITNVSTPESLPPSVDRVFGGWRSRLTDKVSRLLPSPEAELITGMVLGDKRTLPASFKSALVATGTIHIVVASGFNVTLVGSVLVSLLLFIFPRKRANLLAVVAVFVYALFTGGEPPVIRASLMFAAVTLVANFGYPLLTGWVLILVAWVMLMLDPGLIVDVSFQLTLASTAGLVWLAPTIQRLLPRGGELASTLAAQIASAPVIIYHFGQISFIAPLVNLLVLPLVAPLTIGGSVLVLTSIFSQYLSLPFVWFCYGLSHLFVILIGLFSRP